MKNLRTARIAMHLTQEELGNKVNIKKASISKYERGTMQPSQETLVKLADILGVTVDYLLGRPQKDPRDMEDDEFYASLTEGERQLLEYYRNASDEARRIVDRIVDDGLDNR